MSNKNIIGNATDTKNIINRVNTERVQSENSVSKKTITTDSVSSFMRNSRPLYKGKLNAIRGLTNVLTDAGILNDRSLPKTKKELVKIKGIGEKTAKKILKILKAKK